MLKVCNQSFDLENWQSCLYSFTYTRSFIQKKQTLGIFSPRAVATAATFIHVHSRMHRNTPTHSKRFVAGQPRQRLLTTHDEQQQN